MESSVPDYGGTLVAGRYRVEKLLGRGAMGSVWSGRHTTLGQLVAIKFIHPKLIQSDQVLRRFETEAKAATLIKSRHAVAVYDHGVTESGQPYIVMEYLDGEALEATLQRRGSLPLKEVTEIVAQAALALQAAHDAGVIHRDLKPDNVFLAKDPEAKELGYCVKIVDFGIAKIAHEQVAQVATTQAGTILGTPFYMSPEALAASSPVSPRSDVWALGACAFAAACGVVPFQGEALGDVVLKVCAAPLPVPTKYNPSLPAEFDVWFAKACARQPARRFQSAREMADALRELSAWHLEHLSTQVYQLRPRQLDALELNLELDAARPSGRGKALAGVLIGIAMTVGVLGYYVRERTREADAVAAETAARASRIIEEENRRKLEEHERRSARGTLETVPAASASAAVSSERPPARAPRVPRPAPRSPGP